MMSRTLVGIVDHRVMRSIASRKIPNALRQRCRPPVIFWGCFLAIAGCSTAGPFVPDTREKATRTREVISADDVFKRAPWELWRVPTGSARYHRGTGMLL